MSRWKASLIHLSLSATIAASVIAMMLLLWYRPPFFSALGGYHVLLILLGVDVTIGPLITLIIFDLKKTRRALLFDFSVIAFLQITALAYGMSVVFEGRPVFIVFSRDSFDLVTANMLNDADLAKTKPEFQSLPKTGPIYVYSEMPSNIAERNEVVLSGLSGKDLPQFPQYYQPYAEHMLTVAQAAKPVEQLKKRNPDKSSVIGEAISRTGLAEKELGYLPIRAKYEDITALVDKKGEVLATIKIRPW